MNESDVQGPGFSMKKKVDEDWKKTVEKEKKNPAPEDKKKASDAQTPHPNFPAFLSSIAMQVLMALGESEDPSGQPLEPDLGQAQYLIDILQMLSDKMKGNLAKDEEAMFSNLLYELRMKFVQKSKQTSL